MIKRYDSEDSFFYFDPPYVGSRVDTYGLTKSKAKDIIINLADCCKNIKGKFLISHTKNEEFMEILKDFNLIKEMATKYTMSGGLKEYDEKSEVLISNF